MKNLLLLIALLFFFTLDSYSKNYYFSSSIGNDSYTATQAQNPNTPWKSIDKLNNSMDLFGPGDSILFKREDTFIGQIVLTKSGTASGKIDFSAYGSGKAPVLKGLVPVTSWTNYDGNIWVADCPQLGSIVTNFLIDGKSQQIGRYPNINATNKGYLNIDTHSGQTSISSSSMLGYNWSGAKAIIRTQRFLLEQVSIATHQNTNLYFGSPTFYEIKNNFGFFIQNHLSTLDRPGEWYYSAHNKKIYLFLSTDPNEMNIEATAFSTIFEAANMQYFSIKNIEFRGSLNTGIRISLSKNIEIQNNIISESGNDAVNIVDCSNISFLNNKILHTNNNALVFQRCKNILVNNNQIIGTGLRSGMGNVSFIQYNGLYFIGSSIHCESNEIDSVGFNGIYFEGDTIQIKNNFVNHFCMTLDDGGGLYTYNGNKVSHNIRRLENNIIINGIGSPEGTDHSDGLGQCNGVYLDYGTDHVTVADNTVANCTFGIFNSFSHHNSIIGNTLFNNLTQLCLRDSENKSPSPVTNCLVQNNIFYSKSDLQFLAEFMANNRKDIPLFGTFDNNYYCKPLNDNQTIRIIYPETSASGFVQELMDLKLWQNSFNQDLNSKKSPLIIPTYELLNFDDSNKITNSTFENGILDWNCWSPYNNCFASWDNSGKLDNGCLKLNFMESSGQSDGRLFVAKYVSAVVSGESYILKFSMISSNPEKKVKIIMRRGEPPFNTIASDQYFLVTTNRNEYKLLFTPDSSDINARIDFVIDEDNESYWIDNVGFYKAQIRITNTEDSIKFVYNPTTSIQLYNDNKYYIDARGNKYHNFSLQPFTSLVLLNDTANITEQINVTGITINSASGSYSITTIGGTLQLYTNVSPTNATNKTVTWKVYNNTGQALITSSGLVTAVANGTVTVTVTSNDGTGVSESIVITIAAQTLHVTNILVYSNDYKTEISTAGGTLQINATIIPENATDKTVIWSVDNLTGQAYINSNGLLTAIADGTVTVIATANDESGIQGILTITIKNQLITDLPDNELLLVMIDDSKLKIQLYGEINYNKLKIFNMLGNIIFDQKLDQNENIFDVSQMISGIYVILLSGKEGDFKSFMVCKP